VKGNLCARGWVGKERQARIRSEGLYRKRRGEVLLGGGPGHGKKPQGQLPNSDKGFFLKQTRSNGLSLRWGRTERGRLQRKLRVRRGGMVEGPAGKWGGGVGEGGESGPQVIQGERIRLRCVLSNNFGVWLRR